jgi:biopolymer transport protein ExbD
MRFKRSLLSSILPGHIDGMPLISVFFLLLVFLSVLSGFLLSQQGVKLNMPKLLTGEGLVYENIELVVNSGDNVFLNGSLVTDQDLKNLFQQVSKRRVSLLIKSEKKATLGKVMEICNLARGLGISEIRFLSR